MDAGTLLGLIGALAFVAAGIAWGGSSADSAGFLNLPSLFVVLGGTVCATLASYPFRDVKDMLKAVSKSIMARRRDLNDDVDFIIDIANMARREGLRALDDTLDEPGNPFVKKGVMLMVDGCDPALIRDIMRTELSRISERHAHSRAILDSMAAYSPAFGMIGTLIGLINMLGSLDDPGAIGARMALALLAALYGVVLANVVFMPLSKKLKTCSDQECLQKELLLEGMLSVQDGENPRIIRERLTAFIARGAIRLSQDQPPADDAAAEDFDSGESGSGEARRSL